MSLAIILDMEAMRIINARSFAFYFYGICSNDPTTFVPIVNSSLIINNLNSTRSRIKKNCIKPSKGIYSISQARIK